MLARGEGGGDGGGRGGRHGSGAGGGSERSAPRQLPTSDRCVANLVRLHRDDASTDSPDSQPSSPPPEAAEAAANARAGAQLPAALERSADDENSGDAVAERARQSRQWCFGPMHGRGPRCGWGVTPMACFFGAGAGGGATGEAGGGPASRRPGSSGSGGPSEGAGVAGCGLLAPHNSWVCAVLPVDSCSEGEVDAADEEAGNSDDGAVGPDVSTSTGTPPVRGFGSAEAEGLVPSSQSPSDCRSERSR